MKKTKIIVLLTTVAVTLSLLLAACFIGQDRDESGEFATVIIRLGSANTSRQLVGIDSANGTTEDHTYKLSIDGGSQISLELSAAKTLTYLVPIGSRTFEVRAYGDADEIWKESADGHPFLPESTVLRAIGKTTGTVTAAGPNTFQIGLYSATEVNSWEQLAWAAESPAGGSTRKEIIILKPNTEAGAWNAYKTIQIDRPIEIRADGAVTITRASGSPFLSGAFFDVLQNPTSGKLSIGATLPLVQTDTVESIGAPITLDGGGSSANPPTTAPLITVGRDCIIGKDVILQNNKNTSAGSLCYGVAVNSGTFTLFGKITENEASEGGGVYVASGGTFIMDGGIITQNKSSSNGGGVHIANGGTFTMDGGIISQNESSNGGGVYVEGTFNMSSGSITSNTATGFGGGVYVAGTFNIFTSGGGAVIAGVDGNIKDNEDSDPTGIETPNVYLPSGGGGSINIDGTAAAFGW
jgi:hypothetical protein